MVATHAIAYILCPSCFCEITKYLMLQILRCLYEICNSVYGSNILQKDVSKRKIYIYIYIYIYRRRYVFCNAQARN